MILVFCAALCGVNAMCAVAANDWHSAVGWGLSLALAVEVYTGRQKEGE